MSSHTEQDGAVLEAGANLVRADRFYRTIYDEIINWVEIEEGIHVLDAGCGAGGVTALLSKAVGAKGRVTALDLDMGILNLAKESLKSLTGHSQVTFLKADVTDIPLPDHHFNLIWCSRMIHHIDDQLAGIRELHRVLKPNGKIILREGGLRPKFLPAEIGVGEPGLEDRLNVNFQRWFNTHVRPDNETVKYHYGWTQMLRDAGFNDISARTFFLEFLSPFNHDQIDYISHQLGVWLTNEERKALLNPEDQRTLENLLNSKNPLYAFNRTDLHYQEAVTLYLGRGSTLKIT